VGDSARFPLLTVGNQEGGGERVKYFVTSKKSKSGLFFLGMLGSQPVNRWKKKKKTKNPQKKKKKTHHTQKKSRKQEHYVGGGDISRGKGLEGAT